MKHTYSFLFTLYYLLGVASKYSLISWRYEPKLSAQGRNLLYITAYTYLFFFFFGKNRAHIRPGWPERAGSACTARPFMVGLTWLKDLTLPTWETNKSRGTPHPSSLAFNRQAPRCTNCKVQIKNIFCLHTQCSTARGFLLCLLAFCPHIQ